MSALVAKELQEQNRILEEILTRAYLDRVYPVGSVYINVNNTNPSNFIGGTWERLKDRFLLGAGDAYAAGATGGEATVRLTEEEMPKHNHIMTVSLSDGWDKPMVYTGDGKGSDSGRTIKISSTENKEGNGYYTRCYSSGGDEPHNNMPPYLTVYMWKRIA